MGFDALGEPEFKIQQVSDMQAYKQFGNSVVVPVVKEVANYIKPFLLEDINADSEAKTAKHG
jgi:DNA (cytosine-5)-methyltransferase 1